MCATVISKRSLTLPEQPNDGEQDFVKFALPLSIEREFWVPKDDAEQMQISQTGLLIFQGLYYHSFEVKAGMTAINERLHYAPPPEGEARYDFPNHS